MPGVEILSYGESFQVYDAQDDAIGDQKRIDQKYLGGGKRRLTKADDDVKGEG